MRQLILILVSFCGVQLVAAPGAKRLPSVRHIFSFHTDGFHHPRGYPVAHSGRVRRTDWIGVRRSADETGQQDRLCTGIFRR